MTQGSSLQGKVALITGASRGIGEAIAVRFAQEGAKVVLVSRKQEALDKVAEKIGDQAIPMACHVGKMDAFSDLLDRVEKECGGLDILVNNAATNPHFGPILTSEESHWDKVFEVNLKGPFFLTKAAAAAMQKRGGGSIVNMASTGGIYPPMGMGIYGVHKAGLIMLTKVLAQELRDQKITVNAIAPGLVKTAFSKALWDGRSLGDEAFVGTPEDLAQIALGLVTGTETGQIVVLDGSKKS